MRRKRKRDPEDLEPIDEAEESEEAEEEAEPPAYAKKSARGSDYLRKESHSEGLDTVKSYLREIRNSTLLTFEQEQELGKRVSGGRSTRATSSCAATCGWSSVLASGT